jgi:holo-[acyl-carrier protein] synthase
VSPPTAATIATTAPALPAAARRALVETLQEETLHQASEARGSDPDPLRVGVDLVPVADVAASVERLGHRYLYRVFTPHERACARTAAGPLRDGYSMESLAARFAAKEAAVKVLRPTGARPEWRSIEVHRVGGGWCELRLSGLAASLAAEAGITTLAVSVTHESMMAAACVVATRRGDAPARRRTPPPDRRGK